MLIFTFGSTRLFWLSFNFVLFEHFESTLLQDFLILALDRLLSFFWLEFQLIIFFASHFMSFHFTPSSTNYSFFSYNLSSNSTMLS